MEIKKSTFRKMQMSIVLFLMFLMCGTIWRVQNVHAAEVVQVCAGEYNSAVVMSDGSLWVWGNNEYGQFGTGDTKDSLVPIKVMNGVKSVCLGDYSTYVLKTDGTLWAFGDNDFGQLGDGTDEERLKPVKIMSGVASVSANCYHAAVVKTDGTLWTWGDNYCGKLGDNTTIDHPTPIKIMSGVKSVSTGYQFTMAVKTDGTLWTWGANWGNLGDGTYNDRIIPKKVMSGVQSVSGGVQHSLIVKNDGTLWTCGYSECGQLGTKVIGDEFPTPKKIMTGVKEADADFRSSAVVKTDGSLWFFGADRFDDYHNAAHSQPTPVKYMSGVKSASLGRTHMVILKNDGSVWTWGQNAYGQLGTGNKIDQYASVKISFNDTQKDTVKAVTGFTVKSSLAGQVKLTWNKTSDVSGYEVQYSSLMDMTSSTKKSYGSTSTSATVTSESVGKTLYFRIRAYKKDAQGKKTYGKWSSKVSVKVSSKVPAVTSFTMKSLSNQKVKINWGKVKNMSGYEVNFSHKKNFSSLLAKKNLASDAADASITLRKTSPGKTVYARIRPYRIVGNKVYYGSWSKTVSTVMK